MGNPALIQVPEGSAGATHGATVSALGAISSLGLLSQMLLDPALLRGPEWVPLSHPPQQLVTLQLAAGPGRSRVSREGCGRFMCPQLHLSSRSLW